MSLTAKEPENEGFLLVPEGVYQAICIWIYDLGTQYNERWEKESHRVLITWELADLLMNDGRPMVISREYTLSLHEKAQLRKDLESWRGKAFTKEELAGFDLRKILGANCQLQVIQTTTNDRVYSNVSAIMALTKGMPKKKAINETILFSFEEHGEIPDGIPQWILKKIEASKEFKEHYMAGPQVSVADPKLEPF